MKPNELKTLKQLRARLVAVLRAMEDAEEAQTNRGPKAEEKLAVAVGELKTCLAELDPVAVIALAREHPHRPLGG